MAVRPVSTTPAPSSTKPSYTGFDGQYIDGAWRPGKHGSKLSDTDPYSGEVLAEIVQVNKEDLDQAYCAAASAQVAWAAATPITRANVMFRSAQIMEERHAEIVDWIVRESGSTIVKSRTRVAVRLLCDPGGCILPPPCIRKYPPAR